MRKRKQRTESRCSINVSSSSIRSLRRELQQLWQPLKQHKTKNKKTVTVGAVNALPK